MCMYPACVQASYTGTVCMGLSTLRKAYDSIRAKCFSIPMDWPLWCQSSTTARPRADLLVTKTVGGTVELPDVERARLRAPEATRYHDAIAGLQSRIRHANLGKLEPIVHF